MIKIGKEDLAQLLCQATFRDYGDDLEKKYGHYLSERFPRCEEFWHFFVVPLTKRIENSEGKLGTDIHFRDDLDDKAAKLKYIATAHYSMFAHLAYAHLHFDNPVPSSLEDIYTHLGSACELAETVIRKWHLVRLICQDKPSKLLQQLDRKSFIIKAGKWYDEHYSEIYEYYLSEGKSEPIRLPTRDHILKEYLGKQKVRLDYEYFSRQLRHFRNAVVHDIKVGKFITPEGLEKIPKINIINSYRTWEEIEKVKDDKAIIERDFEEKNAHILGSIRGLETRLNDLWEKLIQDFMDEFYSTERKSLRDMFCIDLSDTPGVFTITMPQLSELGDMSYHPESGSSPRPNSYGFDQSISSATFTKSIGEVKVFDEKDKPNAVQGSGLINQEDDAEN